MRFSYVDTITNPRYYVPLVQAAEDGGQRIAGEMTQ